MTPLRSRFTAALSLVLLASVAAGCADPGADPRAAGPAPLASGKAQGYCPLPEEQRATPTPCITQDWNARVAENHAYREPMPITARQKAGAEPQAKALAAVLTELAKTGTTESGIRAAVAEAVGVEPARVELRGDDFAPLRNVLVGGGEGRVCVNGRVDLEGHARAEVIGRTADGTCLPGLGGH